MTIQGTAVPGGDYQRPQLRSLGTLGGLTMGMNGSCTDGGSLNNLQLGGGVDMHGCVSGDAMGGG